MSARTTLPIAGIVGALLALQLLPTPAFADDRRPDPASLSVMTINTYFMWDGVAPEGSRTPRRTRFFGPIGA